MRKISNGNIQLSYEQEKDKVIISLEANQYDLEKVTHYQSYLMETELFLRGEITSSSEESLNISYQLPQGAVSIFKQVQQSNYLERLSLARKCTTLFTQEGERNPMFLHPENIFLISDHIQVAHRGLRSAVAPKERQETTFLHQYKGLILSILIPKYDYESAVSGELNSKDKLSQEIIQAETVKDIEQIIDKQFATFQVVRQREEQVVRKGKYSFFRFSTALLFFASVGLGIALFISMGDILPRRERIIDSKTAFLANNFHEAVTVLVDDEPESLPRSAQFILASSYVQLENLTSEQQRVILNNLSMNSSENELLYWIQTGRGQFTEGLNTAQILGDQQLILHAYTQLYDFTYINTSISGAERMELLAYYEERITEVMALLEGRQEEETDEY